MEINKFIVDILLDLKNNNENCINKINNNKNLIQLNLNEDVNPNILYNLVLKINYIILHTKTNYNLIEKVLKHPFFTEVYAIFQNSDILIEACKIGRTDTLKWLLTMGINPCIQDEKGMTALMHASKNPDLLFVVKILAMNIYCLNIKDKYGENALFHALHNIVALNELLRTNIDVNLLNNNNETPLLYCCKYNIFEAIQFLTLRNDINVNFVDNEERTAAMYLAEKGRKAELTNLKKRNCNYDFKNKKNESVLSLVLKNMYYTIGQSMLYLPYIRILTSYIHSGHNFDIPIDENENTPIMLLILVNDIHTLNYVLNYSNNYNLSLKNKYGESACSLALKYKLPKGILNLMIKHPTFDINYKDPLSNNNILMLCSMTEPMMIESILKNNSNLINSVNNKNENSLILATKSDCKASMTPLFNHHININHQDSSGNTALYYAIDMNDVELIKLLISNGADMNIKNNKGLSPLDYAKKVKL